MSTTYIKKDCLKLSSPFLVLKNNPEKYRKALVTYVELKGFKHGEIGGGHQRCQTGTSGFTLDEIAQELNMSKRNLRCALSIEQNLTNSMKYMLDNGVLSSTTIVNKKLASFSK